MRLFSILLLCLSLVPNRLAWAQADAAQLDFDLTPLPLKSSEHDRIAQPWVTWEVASDPAQVCARRQASGRRQYSSACATWDVQAQRCHIVTTARVSHSQLGHLLVACMRVTPS